MPVEEESKNLQTVDGTTTPSKESPRKTEKPTTPEKRPAPCPSALQRTTQQRWAFPFRPPKQVMQAAPPRRDVTARLQPSVINEPEDYVLAARRILHRRRMAGKLLPKFGRSKSANYAALLREVQDANTEQLDVNNMDRLLQTVETYQVPVFPGRRYTAEDVDRITERLSTYDPEKIPESRGYEVKLELPVVYKRQYTDEEIYDIVKRLSHYDPHKCPPESRGPGATPVPITAPSRQTLGAHVKKCSAQQVQDIVNRLSRYDPWKWPPSSRNPRLLASRA